MFAQWLKKSRFFRTVSFIAAVSFFLTSVPVSYAYMDKLKPSAAKDDLGGGDIVEKLKERGEEAARGADRGFITALEHKAVNAVLERLEGRNPKYTVYDIADDHKLTELEPEQIKGKLFFVRGSADVAFTVKLEEKKDFSIDDLYNPKLIADDIRIKAFIPTLKYIIENGGKIVLQPGWIGRPKGKEIAQFSLIPVYLRLKQLLKEEGLLKEEMLMAPNSLGGQIKSVYRNQEEVRKTVATLKEGQIVLLENPRFDPEEDANDEGYAQFLASLADYYVSDCFAQLHRPTGSIKAITKYLPAYMGIQEEGEIRYIRGIREELLKKERKSFIFILAGKKIETGVGIVSKMTVALSLLNNMQPQDKIKVGGAMAYTFMVAANYLDKVKAGMDEVKKITPQDIKGLIGDSFVEWGQIYDQIFIAGQVLLKAAEKKVKISLPSDHLIRNKETGEIKVVEGLIPEGWYGVDIGTQTINDWIKDIEGSGIGVIAGPVGICDDPKIPEATKGTEAMMRALEKIIGISAGGETTEFASRIGAKLTFESKGGGSTLELIEKGTLVGYNALLNDGFGIIHIQAVPGMTEAIRAELKKLGETRDIFIRGHYPIRLVEEGKDPPIAHTYIYIDKDAYDEKLAEHEIGELQGTRKFATRDKEKLWTTRDRGKVWTLNELVEWLEIKGEPEEVEAFLNQRHKEAPQLPEGAEEIVKDLPSRVMLADAAQRPVRGAAEEAGVAEIIREVVKRYVETYHLSAVERNKLALYLQGSRPFGQAISIFVAQGNFNQSAAEKIFQGAKTDVSREAAKLIQTADNTVYTATKQGFDNVVNSLKDLTDSKGALVVSAEVILENAGTIATLKQIKEGHSGLKIVVWATEQDAIDKLEAMGVGEIADTIINISPERVLGRVLNSLKDEGIPEERIALVSTDFDYATIDFAESIYGWWHGPTAKLQNIMIPSRAPSVKIGEKEINAMPLVFSRAIAGIFQNEESVLKSYQELVKNYKISKQDLAVLNNLTEQESTVPLVKVSEETAQAAATYEVAFEEVGGKV